MNRLSARVSLILFCCVGCTGDTFDWLWPCPSGAISVDGQCEWTYSQLSAGSNHTCAIVSETHEVVCWGQGAGASSWPQGVAFRQLSTSFKLSCGIERDSGAIRCWGDGAPSDLPTSGSYSQVVVDGRSALDSQARVCAIRSDDATVQCWGQNLDDAAAPPTDVAFSAIALSHGGCGIRRADSRLQCWGGVEASALPDGEFCSLSSASPTVRFCGLRCDGAAECFGGSIVGAIPSELRLRELQVGLHEVCGLAADSGSLVCIPGSSPPLAPPAGVALEQLALGGDFYSYNQSNEQGDFAHGCALRKDDHRVVCWGDDTVGQVSGAPSFTRYTDLASRTFPIVSHQPAETLLCGLRERDQRASCWLDEGGPSRERAYSAITPSCGILAADGRSDCHEDSAPDVAFSEVNVNPGSGAVCGIRADDGTAQCWAAPARMISDVPSVALHGLVVGIAHACALRNSDNQAVCWGEDSGGPISDLPHGVAFSQLQVKQMPDFFGYEPNAQTCGVRESDALVQCWGTRDALIVYPPPTVPVLRLSADGRCAILPETHEIGCFDRSGGAVVAPEVKGVRFRELADSASCGIREADSLLTCWGGFLWNPAL